MGAPTEHYYFCMGRALPVLENYATFTLYVLAGQASSLKRRRRRTKQGEDGAAVKIARCSKPISDFGNRKRENFFLWRKSNQNAMLLIYKFKFEIVYTYNIALLYALFTKSINDTA